MANKFFRRRTLVLLALVVLSIVMAKVSGSHGNHFGMWDGPLP